MDSIRQNKVARLLQKELSTFFQQQSKTYFKGTMISVTMVRVTPDLSGAKVYLSFFPSEKTTETMAIINELNKMIKYDLAQIVKKQLRKVPDLIFFVDDSLDYIERIDELLKS